MATAFDRDTAVEARGDGVYAATMSDGWFAPRGPNGGYVAAVVLRAMEHAVGDPARAPRSITLHYTRPPAAGPCEVHITVERVGRGLSTLSARLLQDGRLCVLALAAFAVEFPAHVAYAEPPPAVREAPKLKVPDDPGLPSIARRFALWYALGERPFSSAGRAETGGWLRLAEPQVADAAVVAAYTDAWLPAPFPRLDAPIPAPTIDLTIHFRAKLPHAAAADPDAPLLARFVSRTAHEGFFEEDGELWAPDGTLLAQSRQLAILLPVA